MNDALLRLALLAVAVITVFTGLCQLVMPGWMLAIVGGESSPDADHFFATVGMFMTVTGAMFAHALWQRTGERVVALWIGVQKLAAAALVVWGIHKGLMGPIAYGIAAVDLATGILAWILAARHAQ